MKDRRRIICTNLETRNLFTDETGTYRRLITENGFFRTYAFDKSKGSVWSYPGQLDTWINIITGDMTVIEDVGYQHSILNFLGDIPEDSHLLFHSVSGSWVFRRPEIKNLGIHTQGSKFIELEFGIKLNFFKNGTTNIYELGRWTKGYSDLKIDPDVTYFDGKYFTELVEITKEEYERFKRTGQI
jgi:hypothetical protein